MEQGSVSPCGRGEQQGNAKPDDGLDQRQSARKSQLRRPGPRQDLPALGRPPGPLSSQERTQDAVEELVVKGAIFSILRG